MHIGVSDFVTKPFKIEQIKNVIHRVLNDSLISSNKVDSTKNSEELKIEYNDLCRQSKTCFLAQDTTENAGHMVYDFIDADEFRAFLFGSIPHGVSGGNLDIMIKTIFRNMMKVDKSPAFLLKEVNQYLCKNILQRFPIALLCAIVDKQKQTLCYSIYGEEIMTILSLPNREISVLESSPFPLNMFPGMTIIENTVSSVSDSKLVCIRNSLLLKGFRSGAVTVDKLRDAISGECANSMGMAEGIKLQLERLTDGIVPAKDSAVMVSNVECDSCPLWEEVISVSMPIRNFEQMLDWFDKKLSTIVTDNFERYQIITSINEAVLNAAFFAYNNNEKGEVSLKFTKLGDELIVEVRDRGCGFNAETYREPDVTLCQNITRKSGRGIFLMRQLMDRVMIQSSEAIGTSVHMAKRVTFNEN